MRQVKEKCLKTLSEYRERQCRCHVWRKTVPEVGAGNWKSPFANGRKVERRYSKLVGESRLESLPGCHVSDTGEVWRRKLQNTMVHCRSKLGRSYYSW